MAVTTMNAADHPVSIPKFALGPGLNPYTQLTQIPRKFGRLAGPLTPALLYRWPLKGPKKSEFLPRDFEGLQSVNVKPGWVRIDSEFDKEASGAFLVKIGARKLFL